LPERGPGHRFPGWRRTVFEGGSAFPLNLWDLGKSLCGLSLRRSRRRGDGQWL